MLVLRHMDRLVIEVFYTGLAGITSETLYSKPFHFCELYLDDKAIMLDSSEMFISHKGKLVNYLAKKNSYLQETMFDANAQPFHALIDSHSGKAVETFIYGKKSSNFIKLLRAHYNMK